MTRPVVTLLVIWLFSAGAAIAQVKITVPKERYKVQEQIRAKVENRGARSITICIEVGQWSLNGAEIESTPTPFFVEQNSRGKWHTLLIGPDIGSFRHAEELGAGNSLVFPFRLNGTGTMRLRLEYWLGSKANLDCAVSSKHAKQAASAAFSVE